MINLKKTEKIANSAEKITIEVSLEKSHEIYNNILTDYKKSIQIPGFRKGKVPREVILRKVGDDIKKKATLNIINEALKLILDNKNIKPISNPVLEDFQELDLKNPYVFKITYDVYPKVNVADYKNMVIEEPVVSILKKHVDSELEILRIANAGIQDDPGGVISSNSIVTMDYVELDADGNEIGDTGYKNFVLDMYRNTHPYGIDSELVGMKLNEESVIEKKVDGNNKKIQVNIRRISERILPDLDDELAQDISEELKTLSDLKKRIKSELQNKTDSLLRKLNVESIFKKLYDATELEIPNSMVEKEYQAILKQYDLEKSGTEDAGINDFMKDKWKSLARSRAGVILISQKIGKLEKIEVTEDELSKVIKERYPDLFKESGQVADSDNQNYRQYLENTIKGTMWMDKLHDLLINVASIKKGKKIDYKDFIEEVEKKLGMGLTL